MAIGGECRGPKNAETSRNRCVGGDQLPSGPHGKEGSTASNRQVRLRSPLVEPMRGVRPGSLVPTGRLFFERAFVHTPRAERARPRNWTGFVARFEAQVLSMSTRGRRPRFSQKERERVVELAGEGASQRQIAEEVFGNVRYRGRVERILAADARASSASDSPRNAAEEEATDEDFRPRSDVELFRELVGRAERAMLRSDVAPSLADVERLLRIKRQLGALESVERVNAIALALEGTN